MSRHKKTVEMIEVSKAILTEIRPMTVRQVYYQLVSRQVIKNSRCQYQAVSKALVNARREGIIPWDWIEDRLRRPRKVNMWSGLPDFAVTCCTAYRRDVWETQPGYVEVWLEKDALSGIFEDVLRPYGVTLNVARGYDGWSSIHGAAERYRRRDNVTVLYFGDFDPSGEDMVRSLIERLRDQGAVPDVIKCALTREDIERYDLPPDFAKRTDTRTAAFIAKHGNISVELDALPPDVLRSRLLEAVTRHMDIDALADVKALEERERQELLDLLGGTEGE